MCRDLMPQCTRQKGDYAVPHITKQPSSNIIPNLSNTISDQNYTSKPHSTCNMCPLFYFKITLIFITVITTHSNSSLHKYTLHCHNQLTKYFKYLASSPTKALQITEKT